MIQIIKDKKRKEMEKKLAEESRKKRFTKIPEHETGK